MINFNLLTIDYYDINNIQIEKQQKYDINLLKMSNSEVTLKNFKNYKNDY